ncbi:MAG: formyltransferase family protein [Candidatus Paceibacterota bacterium]
MKENYLVATAKSWNNEEFNNLKNKDKKNNWFLITDKKDLTPLKIKKINPKIIFFPHWSWIISEDIWSNFECIVFHMTDLPYGRGGSPLQNLIMRGHTRTKISALRVNAGLDTGDIYCQKNLSLKGNAEEIFRRAAKNIFRKIIPFIINNHPKPKSQQGKIVLFKRRKPKQSKILPSFNLNKTYDIIRMLDAEGYPQAFLETKKLKFDLSKAKFKNNKIIAQVDIYEK